MNNPKVSFIIITYNTKETYLKKSIDSIIQQTYRDIEIIIVDDGSTNGTEKLCDGYANYDSRIQVIHQKNSGAGVARNKGIEIAQGEWIAFIDSDDWVSLNMAENIQKHFSNEQDIISFGYADYIGNKYYNHMYGNSESIQFKKSEFESIELAIMKDKEETEKYPMFFGAVWNCVYRREFLNRNNIRFVASLRRAQDAVFNLHAIEKAGNIMYLKEEFYYYRIHNESICHRFAKNPQIYDALINELFKFCQLNNKDIRFYKAYDNFRATFLLESIKLHYFHKDNPSPKKERINQLDKSINKEPYKSLMVKYDNIDLNKKQKLQLNLLKNKKYFELQSIFRLYYKVKSSQQKIYDLTK
ncbi:glycosyltransferase family 2 protein [Carnobacterium mobile]|uniref:glycosyltransferase family 2 protein n=1 Tax=Carnobacterium mobile TaxID=2750 RepID=UPI0005561F1F|nr:glycosyltransferase [Carnobacterium mobile]